MKILQINKFFYLRGGSERYMFDLSAILKKNGHTVVDFSMADARNWPSAQSAYFAENVSLDKFSLKSIIKFFYNRDAIRKLEALVKLEKPDIAHLHNIAHHLTPHIIKVLKKHGIPVVQTLHDYKLICPNYRLFSQGEVCYRCQGGKYMNCVKRKCIKDSTLKSFLAMLEAYMNNNIYDKIDLFIAPSQFMKNVSTQFGVSGNKIRVVYNFTNQEIKKSAASDNKDKYLLYFGRLSDEKGIATLVRSMENVKDFKLKIVGAGPEYQSISSLIDDMALYGKVEMLGPKYGKELTGIIENSTAIVIPSIWPENMPMSILEAMAIGKPVIGSRIGGIPEIVKDGMNGFLFEQGNAADLSDKIRKLSSSDLSKLSDGAIETAKRFGPEKHSDQIISIYKELI